MTTYYVGSIIVVVLLILACTAIVLYALWKKGDVSAGLTLNRVGFTLTAKHRPSDTGPKSLVIGTPLPLTRTTPQPSPSPARTLPLPK